MYIVRGWEDVEDEPLNFGENANLFETSPSFRGNDIPSPPSFSSPLSSIPSYSSTPSTSSLPPSAATVTAQDIIQPKEDFLHNKDLRTSIVEILEKLEDMVLALLQLFILFFLFFLCIP